MDDFLAGTVPFIHDGLAAEEPVLVALVDARKTALVDALGDSADRVQFVDMPEIGRNPARIIPRLRAFLDSAVGDGQPVRGIGEPVWAGRRPEEIIECQLHESLLNVAVCPDTPLWLMCAYDTVGLDAGVVEEAHRSHPAIVDASAYKGSTLYGGRAHVDEMFGSQLPSMPDPVDELPFCPRNVDGVLSFVALRAFSAGARADKAADLSVAVQELVNGSLHRGSRHGTVQIWSRPDAVVCEVHDDAQISDPMTGRTDGARDRRNGLWVANHLCDLVQLRSNAAGTTVRVHHWL